MPYCPECKLEYPPGTDRCPRCKVALADSTATGFIDASEMKLALLARFSNVSQADMVSELLETNGIHAVVRGDVDPLAGAVGPAPTTLYVLEDDFDRAQEIYEAFFAGPFRLGSSDSADDS